MDTTISFSFQARRYVPPELEQHNSIESRFTGQWVMSAGRWDTMAQAAKAAGDWLLMQAAIEPQQYEIAVIQVEELVLANA